ncbi:MAG: PorV/PorQ family protein [Ignavibacteriae bacterium]|nr:MAG: PorV/PorQ family protein [Ignavibacteriota bacterium]
MKFEKENKKVKRLIITCLTAIIIIGLQTSLSYSQQVKLAQTGFNFLSISSDARAGAMGDAVTTIPDYYTGALSHNPASMGDMKSLLNANVSVNNWIADIKYLSCDAVIAPFSGNYGVIGLSFQSVNYGDVQGTMVANNSKGYIETDIMKPTAMALGIGYSKMISEQFGVGAQVRFAYQALGTSVVPDYTTNTVGTKKNVAKTTAFDFGTIFKTGIKSIAFGMSVRNFSQDIKFEEEEFQLPLLFSVGLSANVFDFFDMKGPEQSLILSCDLTHPRSHPEQLKIGAEYQFMKLIALRGGYISGDDEDGVTFGVGVTSSGLGLSTANFAIDYSYTPFGVFDKVQRFTVSFSM